MGERKKMLMKDDITCNKDFVSREANEFVTLLYRGISEKDARLRSRKKFMLTRKNRCIA